MSDLYKPCSKAEPHPAHRWREPDGWNYCPGVREPELEPEDIQDET